MIYALRSAVEREGRGGTAASRCVVFSGFCGGEAEALEFCQMIFEVVRVYYEFERGGVAFVS